MIRYIPVLLLLLALGCTTDSAPERLPVRLHFAYKSLQVKNDSLYPPFPNPYSHISGDSTIALSFALRDSGSVILLIQNVIGEEIAGYSDSALGPGVYNGRWNPLASNGNPLQSGLYFITLHTQSYISSRLVNLQNND